MKKTTKFLSLFAIIISLFTAFAVQGFAADEEIKSVTLGGVGTYSYTITDNEITITKFETNNTDITLEIPSEYNGMKVTKIGDDAFKEVTGLKKIVIPNSVTHIGTESFYDLSETEIIVPEKLEYVGKNAFWDCDGIEELNFSDSLTYIGYGAFYSCDNKNLTEIRIPDSVTFIGESAFTGNSIEKMIVGNLTNATIEQCGISGGDVLVVGNLTNCTLKYGAFTAYYRTEATFGDFIGTTVGNALFMNCANLKTLKFGNVSGITFDSSTFINCTKLETIEFESMTDCKFAENTFSNCTALSEVDFGTCEDVAVKNYAFSKSGIKSITIPEGVRLGQYVFNECPNLETAIIHGTELTQIERRVNTTTGQVVSERFVYSEYLFQKCPVLKEVVLSNYETVYEQMFYNCTALEKVTLGATKKIDKYGFKNCSSLKEVNFENNLEIGYMAFESCTSLEYFDFSRVDWLGVAGFRYCTSLKSIDLSNLKTISSEAFFGCTSLENIDLSKVEVIYSRAFGDCDGLKELHINNNIQFDNQVFYDCSNLEKVYIDDNVQYIYFEEGTTVDDIFEECNNLKYFYIGKNFMPTVKVDDYYYLNTDSLGFFFMVGLEEIEVSPENPYYFTDDGVLYVDEGEVVILLCYPAAKQGEYYSTENALKNIEKDFSINILAFSLNQNIKEVNFTKAIVWPEFMDDSDSMKSYDLLHRSFFKCSVEKVTFPENGLKIIGHYMFKESQIREIDLTGVEEIMRGAFMNCKNIQEANLLSCTTICDDAFSGCTALKIVNAPLWNVDYETVWYDRWDWPASAFSKCTALETVNIPSLTVLPEYCFYGCTSLKSVKADACIDVERYCFYGCESLETFYAPLCEYVSEYAFYNCSSLESVDMKLITINECSFAGCTSLKSVNFEKTRYIEDNAFAGCTSLETVNLCGVTRIRPYAFSGCTGLTLAIFDNTSCEIYDNAFANCPNLTFDCEEDTEAYNYAVANNIPFTAIKVSFQNDTYEYTGSEIEPSIIVSISGMALIYNEDYTLTFENNVEKGTAKVTVHFIGNFEGLRDAERTFRIVSCDIKNAQVEYVVDNEYSGEEVRPKVVVKCGDKVLTEGTDYTITYNSGADTGSMFFTIKGIGNYTGSIDCYYNIIRRDIAEATVSKDNDMIYTGEEVMPKPVITWNGFTLVEGVDYEIRYFENVNSGYGTMVIYGMGNFCGTQRVQFRIFGKNIENAVVSEIPDQMYTGEGITPEVTVTLDGVALIKDVDYTVKYENNIEKGVATVTISGIGNYSGVVKQSFNINKISVYSFTVFSETEMTETFDGTELKPEMEVYYGTELLTEGVDYTVSLENNVNAGTATVTIIGIGLYDGERSYGFTILPCEITENDISISGSMEFNGSAVEPEVSVYKNGATLVEGEDYTVTYSNNENVGTAYITVEGIGNYENTITLEYEIYSAQNSDGWTLENGRWAYYKNGERLKNRWIQDSVSWCYLGADGYCVANKWVKDSVTWCYIGSDCRIVTDKWQKDSVGWCYLGADGRMVTDKWVKDSVGWCYIDNGGHCVTNGWAKDSHGWCYLDNNGRMVYSRWVQYGEEWYYIDENGYMVTGTKVIGGKEYRFASNGIWIE